MDVKLISIDKIGLSTRSRNALQRAGVHLVGEMLDYNEESLRAISQLGNKSIDEIMEKIAYYRKVDAGEEIFEIACDDGRDKMPGNLAAQSDDEYNRFVYEYLKQKKVPLDAMELLSARAYNVLLLGGYCDLADVLFQSEDELLQIPHMDMHLSGEIMRACLYFAKQHEKEFRANYKKQMTAVDMEANVFDLLKIPEYQTKIREFAQINDRKLGQTELSEKTIKKLMKNGYLRMSELVTKTSAELLEIPKMNVAGVKEIEKAIHAYMNGYAERILAVLAGDQSKLWDDDAISRFVLDMYDDAGFRGFTIQDFKNGLESKGQVTDERLKKVIGRLLAEHQLEYVDYRCYRVYERFEDYLDRVATEHDRNYEIIRLRLRGKTLEEIGKLFDLTRERVRQIINKTVADLQNRYLIDTGMEWFDEDYYRYFYSTYHIEKKDAEEWLGIDRAVFCYLEMRDVKPGKQDLSTAMDDVRNLDVGLLIKINNYLNRNRLYIDGIWVDKKRKDLEDVVVRKYCAEDVCYKEFSTIYNHFLQAMEVPYDDQIYMTDTVYRTRSNRLKESRALLWKYGEMMRAYDVDSRDYTELFEALNLDSYENIELSTLKFIEENPELMAKYDIRDQYELHDLLRKVLPEGSFHGFKCGRMPHIIFGDFDRDAAIFELLSDNAPISAVDLADLIHKKYGYAAELIQSTYLKPFAQYYYNGIYDVAQKQMSEEHKKLLKNALTDDFYYFDEIRKIYAQIVPKADTEEINPYNLKSMGFVVLSNYALQHYPTLEAYSEGILTQEDIVDISKYRKRLVYVQMFSQKLMELKRNLEVIEFEPNQIINFRRLSSEGITKDMLRAFCDEVYSFVQEGTYFSAKSIRNAGFCSALYDLGFSEWFYANLLLSDDRFSFAFMFKNMIFYKGKKNITIKSFESSLVQQAGSIDIYDLMKELSEIYGCQPDDKFDVLYKLNGSEIYYDKILERLYANSDLYYRELDKEEWV